MKPDETPPPGQPNSETPPASLTAVRVSRRKAMLSASGKPGDLTQKLGDAPADARAAGTGGVAPAPAAAPVPPPPAAEPPRAIAPAPPAVAEPRPARLLAEEEIRQLLDPPERRAAPTPPPAPALEPPPPPVQEPTLTVDPDEREAIPPAPSAPELRLVAEGAALRPQAEEPTERAPNAGKPTSSIDQIIDYWDSLRGGKPFPPLDALDRSHVSRSWPNCLLVAYGANDAVMPRLTRLGEENGDIEYLEMVIHWILSRGRIAARKGEPMEEEKRFPVTAGNARYQLLLLPLATPEGTCEHVLCHLSRVKETAKGGAFKRWLAS